jgi:hypothetical protein
MADTILLTAPEGISMPALKKAREPAIATLREEGELSASRDAAELDLSTHDFLDLLADHRLSAVLDFHPHIVEEAPRKLSPTDRP